MRGTNSMRSFAIYNLGCKVNAYESEYIKEKFKERCIDGSSDPKIKDKCETKISKKVFRTGLQEYILTLPDYKTKSANGAQYRVIASFKHTRDNNNYYSYATMEVDR